MLCVTKNVCVCVLHKYACKDVTCARGKGTFLLMFYFLKDTFWSIYSSLTLFIFLSVSNQPFRLSAVCWIWHGKWDQGEQEAWMQWHHCLKGFLTSQIVLHHVLREKLKTYRDKVECMVSFFFKKKKGEEEDEPYIATARDHERLKLL